MDKATKKCDMEYGRKHRKIIFKSSFESENTIKDNLESKLSDFKSENASLIEEIKDNIIFLMRRMNVSSINDIPVQIQKLAQENPSDHFRPMSNIYFIDKLGFLRKGLINSISSIKENLSLSFICDNGKIESMSKTMSDIDCLTSESWYKIYQTILTIYNYKYKISEEAISSFKKFQENVTKSNDKLDEIIESLIQSLKTVLLGMPSRQIVFDENQSCSLGFSRIALDDNDNDILFCDEDEDYPLNEWSTMEKLQILQNVSEMYE